MREFSWFIPQFASNETTNRHLCTKSFILPSMLEENTVCKHVQKDWGEYTPQDTPVILITVSNFWCIDIIDEIVEFFQAPEYRKVLDNVNTQLILEYAQESFMPFLHLHFLAKLLNIHWQMV